MNVQSAWSLITRLKFICKKKTQRLT
jgi:hypothetical protein